MTTAKKTPPKPGKREAELIAEIKSMEALAKDARKEGSFTAAVQARSKVSSLRTELDRLRSEREAESEPDPITRAGRLRRLATEAGSYVAAAGLAKLEAELTTARDLAEKSAKKDGLDGASEDEILAVVEAAILALPDPLVVRIRESAIARLDGRRLRMVKA